MAMGVSQPSCGARPTGSGPNRLCGGIGPTGSHGCESMQGQSHVSMISFGHTRQTVCRGSLKSVVISGPQAKRRQVLATTHKAPLRCLRALLALSK
eukprot:162450-Pelagomonas_calceolata.AAC.2